MAYLETSLQPLYNDCVSKKLFLSLLLLCTACTVSPTPDLTTITPFFFTPPPELETSIPAPEGTLRPTPTFAPTATSPLPTPQPFTPLPVPSLAPDALSPENVAGMRQLSQWGKGRINAFALTPDGRSLVVASSTGVHVYDARTLNQTQTLAPSVWVSLVAVHPDGNTIALAYSNVVELWSLAAGTHLNTLTGHTDVITALAFSPHGRTLASAAGEEDNSVRLWDVSTGGLIHTLSSHQKGVGAVAFSPDGLKLASGDGNASLFLWNVVSGQPESILQGHAAGITALAFSPDGEQIASGSAAPESSVKVWSIRLGRAEQTMTGHTNMVVRVVYTPAGDGLASASLDHTVRLWDPATGLLTGNLQGQDGPLVGAAYSQIAGDLSLITASGQVVRFWNPATGERVKALGGYTAWVGRVAFTPQGRLLAAKSYENFIELQDVTGVLDGDVAADSPGLPLNGNTNLINTMIISPDGTRLVSGGWDGTARVWDISTGDKLSPLNAGTAAGELLHTLVGHQAMVWSAAFSPDGSRLATGSLGELRLWDVATGRPLTTLIGHNSWVTALAFSPDGRYLASASVQEVWVWDAVTGKRILQLSGHPQWVSSLAFSPDSKVLATGGGASDYAIRLFEIPSGRGIAVLTGHEEVVGGLAFNPDGSLLASGSRDGVIRVWNMATFQPLAVLTGHALWVDTLAFSPDGKMLVSGGLDGTVRVWGVVRR